MKAQAYLFPIGMLSLFLTVSCSFTIFDKVEVKATPSLNASVGSTNFIISDYLNTEDMTKMFSGSSGMKAYSYIDPAEKNGTQIPYPLPDNRS